MLDTAANDLLLTQAIAADEDLPGTTLQVASKDLASNNIWHASCLYVRNVLQAHAADVILTGPLCEQGQGAFDNNI